MSIQSGLRILILPIYSEYKDFECELVTNYIIHTLKFKFATFNKIKIVEFKAGKETYDEELDKVAIDRLKKKFEIDYCIHSKVIKKNDDTFSLESTIWNSNNTVNTERISSYFPTVSYSLEDIMSNSADIKYINNFISQLVSRICLFLGTVNDEEVNSFLGYYFAKDSIYLLSLKECKPKDNFEHSKLDILNRLLVSDKENPLYLYEKALCLKDLKQYNESISLLTKAIKYSKFSLYKSLLFFNLGNMYKIIGKNNLAIDNWSNALQYSDNYTDPMLNLAQMYEDEDNLQESEKYYLSFQEIQPEDARSYLNLARIYCKKEAWQRAIEEYKKHLVYFPYDAWSHSNMANCYLCVGKDKLAKKHLEEAIKLDCSGEAGIFSKYVLESLSKKIEVPWWKFWAKI